MQHLCTASYYAAWPLQLAQGNHADFVYDWVRRHPEATVRDSLYVVESGATVPSPRSTTYNSTPDARPARERTHHPDRRHVGLTCPGPKLSLPIRPGD